MINKCLEAGNRSARVGSHADDDDMADADAGRDINQVKLRGFGNGSRDTNDLRVEQRHSRDRDSFADRHGRCAGPVLRVDPQSRHVEASRRSHVHDLIGGKLAQDLGFDRERPHRLAITGLLMGKHEDIAEEREARGLRR